MHSYAREILQGAYGESSDDIVISVIMSLRSSDTSTVTGDFTAAHVLTGVRQLRPRMPNAFLTRVP
jgi:hypothetical protein